MTKMSGRPLVFGEVLYDRFPDGSSVLGGAPFNVAWHLQALGKRPLFVSRVGHDEAGRSILARMEGWGMDTDGLQTDVARPTGSVDVRFVNGDPRFDIVANAAYDYIDDVGDKLPENTCLIYHGTLAMRSETTRNNFSQLLDRCKAPIFLDVNLRAPWWTIAEAERMIGQATWVKLNDEELDHVAKGPEDQKTRVHKLIVKHDLEFVVLTRGAKGAVAVSKSGQTFEVFPDAKADVVDTVGAGDAFASIIVLGLMEGWSLSIALQRAQDLAGRVVGQRGATPSDAGFYNPIRNTWDKT